MRTLNRIISLGFSLVVFVSILLGVNTYQYFKLKNDLASSIIKAVNDAELKDLQTFFQSIESKLSIVRDWGKNGLLTQKSIKNLNKKFIPLIENEASFNGVILADKKGSEYFLSREETGYLIRTTTQKNGKAIQSFQQWGDADTVTSQHQEQTTYNPIDRPWFKPESSLNAITWTDTYTFYSSKQEGFTASVAWQEADSGFGVFAIDILLSSLERLLTDKAADRPGALFLVNPQNKSFITGSPVAGQGEAQQGNLLSQMLPIGISHWAEAGQPSREMISIQHQGEKWLLSMQPITEHGRSFWVGVAAPEAALLNTLDKRFFAVDMLDIAVAISAALILLLFLWKTGSLRHDRPTPAPIVRLTQYINQGEGPGIEFKSSSRMNLKTGKSGKEIELAWLKAVVAFLNTSGGVLLMGVADDGVIVGLKADNYENEDRCLLHLKNLIHQHIGAEFAGCIEVTLVDSGNNQAAMLECKAAPDPVFLRIGKNEEFYIRSGPSSTKLTPSQMVSYIMQNRG